MPPLKVQRRLASMVCFKGDLYVLGGFGDEDVCELSVEMFDSERKEWKKISSIPVRYDTPQLQEKDQNYTFKAAPARICKGVIGKMKPLNTYQNKK